ncbi:hypothetical protein [Actinoplanes derwentensis]|uniref:hypothetical protein n=1 Tax=Actinoplanes derwentensis TaxID=113562 RepID=UPI0012FDF2EC|nr:hypothetical protein [Actinoplanes derwentensis]
MIFEGRVEVDLPRLLGRGQDENGRPVPVTGHLIQRGAGKEPPLGQFVMNLGAVRFTLNSGLSGKLVVRVDEAGLQNGFNVLVATVEDAVQREYVRAGQLQDELAGAVGSDAVRAHWLLALCLLAVNDTAAEFHATSGLRAWTALKPAGDTELRALGDRLADRLDELQDLGFSYGSTLRDALARPSPAS